MKHVFKVVGMKARNKVSGRFFIGEQSSVLGLHIHIAVLQHANWTRALSGKTEVYR